MSRTYSYELTFDDNVGTITVTTSSTATNDTGSGNGYDVTAISGTFDGKTITGEYGAGGVSTSDDNIGPYDNTIFVDDSVGSGGSYDGVDGNGLAFRTADGEYYALYTSGSNFFTETETVAQQPVTLDSFTPPCYCRGARLLAEHGYVAVERLQVGDRLVTAAGGLRPIHWIGRRSLDCRRHRDPGAVWPVRVAAGAFGQQQPSHDLWLSPGHCVAVDGMLIPIRFLMNGHSIAQVETATVEYWHVELDEHDIVLAEGLPAESYLDCGNRTSFANGGAFIETHPDFAPKDWREACLPLAEQGPEVAKVKARLLARLFDEGHELTREADAHILADGRRIDPIRLGTTQLAFGLPEGCQSLILKSKTFIPAHARAESFDDRDLGLCVARLQIEGDDVALEDATLSACDWYGPETDAGKFARRWTRGEALLPAGARLVLINLAGHGYYWREPVETAARAACR